MSVKNPAIPHLDLVIQAEDGTTKTWKICLDYGAIAKIEETVTVNADGKSVPLDLMRPDNWRWITSATFPKIVWCCLQRFNSEVSLEEVNASMNPQAYHVLRGALYEITFPWIAEAAAELAKNGASPNGIPNSPTTA